MIDGDGRIPLPQVDPEETPPGLYVIEVDDTGAVPVLTLTSYTPGVTTALVPWTSVVDGVPSLVWDDDDNLVMTEVEL